VPLNGRVLKRSTTFLPTDGLPTWVCALVIAAVAVCGAVHRPTPCIAQEAAAPAAKAPAAETADPAPVAVSVVDIAGKAAALDARLGQLTEKIAGSDLLERSVESLDGLRDELEKNVAELAAIQLEILETSGLDNLRTDWSALDRELADIDDELKATASELGEQLDELAKLGDQWKLTSESARKESAPQTVLAQVSSTLQTLKKARATIEKHRNDLLEVQSRVLGERETVRTSLQKIQEARRAALARLLVRNADPLWQLQPDPETLKQRGEELARRYTSASEARSRYLSRNRNRVILHVAFILLLYWAMRRGRWALDEAQESGRAAAAGKELGVAPRDALRYPLAAAALLGLSLTPFIHGAAPPEFRRVVGFLILPAWLLVVMGVSPRGLKRFVYLLAVLAYADVLREMATPFVLLSRTMLIVEAVSFVVISVWFLRTDHARELAASVIRGRGYQALMLWVRCALVMAVVSLLAAILGYMNLAVLLGAAAARGSYFAPLLLAAVRVGEALMQALIDSGALDGSRMIRRNRRTCMAFFQRLLRAGGVATWLYLVLRLLSAWEPFVAGVGSVLSAELGYGAIKFSLGAAIAFGVTLWATWLLARFLSFWLEEEVFPRVSLPQGIPFALSTFTRYVILVTGFLTAMAMLGFNIDRLALVISALGVGIGFGLQNVTNNFISGVIMLFERPVRVGDSVQLDTLMGQVKRIGIRASVVRTWDGADVIVPNGDFISARVTNWTFADRKRRIILPVGVAYGTDPQRVIDMLEEIATTNEDVLSDPAPQALFRGFGDSSLDFELRAWTDSDRGWVAVSSDLAIATNAALGEGDIEIPFPQRDLHVRSVDDAVEDTVKRPYAPRRKGGSSAADRPDTSADGSAERKPGADVGTATGGGRDPEPPEQRGSGDDGDDD